MKNRDTRLFFCSFFITLLTVGFLAVFLLVDTTNAQYEKHGGAAALSMTRASDLEYDIDLLGQQYGVSLAALNDWEKIRKEYAPLLTPRAVLTLEQVYSAGIEFWNYLYPLYKEYQFQQNIVSEQPAIP